LEETVSAPAGIKFGHFTLGKRLARGGMAEVFLARQRGPEGFDRRVAVKRILPHLAEAPDFVKMFLSEARLAARLTHPNIVHIYELGQVDGDFFIAMEYVDGVHAGQLMTEVMTDRLPPALVARVGADAAGALAYAHRLEDADGTPLGLVHRDVSPHNLMVSYDGVTKLVDFGIAKAASKADETQPGVVKGKYAYMSPEQTVGRPLDGRSDVFSLGVCLWELLAGRTIVDRGDVVEAMKVIRDGRWTPIAKAAPHTPPALAQAIEWAMAQRRDERATAAQLQVALEAYLKSAPELATQTQLADWIRQRFPRAAAAPTPEVTRAGSTRPERRTTPPPAALPLGTAAARPLAPRTGTAPVQVTDAPPALGTSEVAITMSGAALEAVTPRPPPRPPTRRTTPPPLPRSARPPTHLDDDEPLDAPTRQHQPEEMHHVLPARRGVWIPLVLGLIAVAAAIAFAIVRAGGDGPAGATDTPAIARGPDAAAPIAIALPLPVDAGAPDASATSPPDAPTATLEIITRPSGAKLKVTGHDPVTSPAILTVPVGPATVVVTRDGYAPIERAVELGVGEHRTLELALERRPSATPRPPAEVGYLTVRTNPYSVVMLGNRRLGETPFARIEVPAGTHVLTFTNPTRGSSRRTVLVRPGQTVKLSFNLP
jgi:serine/threonine protein kinase